ncbi:hypothetical protein N9L33_04975 [Nitrospinae bacterium]|nr:hypothetical protein [Nitrospinota bacterium]
MCHRINSKISDILADFSVPIQQRKDALKYLVRIVRDVHQFMHLGNKKYRGKETLRFP